MGEFSIKYRLKLNPFLVPQRQKMNEKKPLKHTKKLGLLQFQCEMYVFLKPISIDLKKLKTRKIYPKLLIK